MPFPPTASLLTTQFSEAPHATSMEMPILPVSDVPSSPDSCPLFHPVFCTFITCCSAKFPISFKALTSQNSQVYELFWFQMVMGHILFKLCLALADLNRCSCIIPDKTLQRLKKKTHMASVHCNQDRCAPFCTSLDREGRKKWSPPHLMPVYEKQAHTQLHFCSSYSPPSCPAGFPFSCAHDFGPPGTEFVL